MAKEENIIELTGEDGAKFKLNLLFSNVRPETGVNYFFFEHPEDKDAIAVFEMNKDGLLEETDLSNEDVSKYLNFILEAYDNGELEEVESEEDDEDEEEEHECCCGHHHHHHEGECCEGDECECGCGCDHEEEHHDDCCCCHNK